MQPHRQMLYNYLLHKQLLYIYSHRQMLYNHSHRQMLYNHSHRQILYNHLHRQILYNHSCLTASEESAELQPGGALCLVMHLVSYRVYKQGIQESFRAYNYPFCIRSAVWVSLIPLNMKRV